jgi:hypothetical protein
LDFGLFNPGVFSGKNVAFQSTLRIRADVFNIDSGWILLEGANHGGYQILTDNEIHKAIEDKMAR